MFDVRHTTHRERQHDRGEIIYDKSSLQGFERRDGGRGDLVVAIPVWRGINDAAEKQVLDHWIVHHARTSAPRHQLKNDAALGIRKYEGHGQ